MTSAEIMIAMKRARVSGPVDPASQTTAGDLVRGGLVLGVAVLIFVGTLRHVSPSR